MKHTYLVPLLSLLFLGLFASSALAKKPVRIPPPTCTLTANPSTIAVGSSTVLTYNSTNATSGSIDNGVGAVGISGTKTVAPAVTTKYTATFTGNGGTVACSATVTVNQTPPPPPPSDEVRITAYITGYGWPDNTPAGNAIAYPVIHSGAGGVGSYSDPITLAVGHSIINNVDIPDYPVGTKFYVPNLRKYFIVEDVCGDGATPQNGPCHSGYPSGTTSWVDVWVGGQGVATSSVYACENAITGAHLIIKNPASTYLVVEGSIVTPTGACSQQFGELPI